VKSNAVLVLGLNVWLRAARVRFFISDVLNVMNGLALAWWASHYVNPALALLTLAGILSLRTSANYLNDYFDFKSGTDVVARSTPLTGGSGVLPEGKIKPNQLYAAGLLFLLVGILVGAFFIVERGWFVALLLAFGGISVYFYTTQVANRGLSELILTVERAAIIIGTYYVQSPTIRPAPVLVGIILGILFASVIFLSQFPDVEADLRGGRRGLVIRLGLKRAAKVYPFFPIIALSLDLGGVSFGILPTSSLLCFVTLPGFVLLASRLSRDPESASNALRVMSGNGLLCTLASITYIVAFII
jgi:1,4-dihydroxy-2-naphthoate octaprenyltransferase